MLLLPDLLTFWLTGEVGAERTNASTTGLYDVRTREWAIDLAKRLGLPWAILPPLRDPGSVVGPLLPEVGEYVGLPDVPVIAVGSHDTASAVVGVPAARRASPTSRPAPGRWSASSSRRRCCRRRPARPTSPTRAAWTTPSASSRT